MTTVSNKNGLHIGRQGERVQILGHYLQEQSDTRQYTNKSRNKKKCCTKNPHCRAKMYKEKSENPTYPTGEWLRE